MHKSFRTLTATVLICIAASCQSGAYTEDSAVIYPREKCRIIETVSRQKLINKFFYDSLGKVSYVITHNGDTQRYYYSATQIVKERTQYVSYTDPPHTEYLKEIYGLDANGLAKYLTLRSQLGVVDSNVFSYDANGYLVSQKVFTENFPYDHEITYSYTGGNLTKVIFNGKTSGAVDSIFFKYTDIDVPAYAMHYLFQDPPRNSIYHLWTGKQSKKLPSESRYYLHLMGIVIRKYSYILDADGKPIALQAVIDYTPSKRIPDTVFASIKYDCD